MPPVRCFRGQFNGEIVEVPNPPQGIEHPYRVSHRGAEDWYELGHNGQGGMLLVHAPHRANEEPAHQVYLADLG